MDDVIAHFSDDGKIPSSSRIKLLGYPDKLRIIATCFERQERGLSRWYALNELRDSLNALSNQALQEQQAMRGY